MDTERMIRNLEKVEEDHKDDKVFTGQLNIADMVRDVRKRLEELKPYEDTDLTPQQIKDMQFCLREKSRECAELRRELQELKNKKNDGWIPVEDHIPGEPKENPVFDDKPLELYLVDMGGSYPLRAFWNGKQFTDGWSVLNVIAWRPLPEPYRPEQPETCKYTGGSCCWPIDQCRDCPNHPERSDGE